MSKQITARALTAYIARRFLRLTLIVACVGLFVILLVSGLLVYTFTAWWWLLAVPFLLLFMLFLLLRFIASVLIHRMYGQRLTDEQDAALGAFSEKIERLIEARGTPPIFFVLLTIKDLLLHRDITTIKGLVADTASLRRDYQALERLF